MTLHYTIMKLSPFFLLVSASPFAAAWQPTRLPYNYIAEHGLELVQALHEVGMVSLTNVFHKDEDSSWRADFSKCSTTTATTDDDTLMRSDVMADGCTLRTTLALQGKDGGINQNSIHCQSFKSSGQALRERTDAVLGTLAEVLLDALDLQGVPLLHTNDSTMEFQEVMENALVLEHFHQYTKPSQYICHQDKLALDWHIDQGMFLAFVPGTNTRDSTPTDGFSIKLRDGTIEHVVFDAEDQLIIMVGDAATQILNPVLSNNKLRALPHALDMPTMENEDDTRIWYGRMMLPPLTANHPIVSHLTYAELRADLRLKDDATSTAAYLGCSNTRQRILQETADACQQDEAYCWHKCVAHSSFEGVSMADCAERQLTVGCVNAEGLLWDGSQPDAHSSAFSILECINETSIVVFQPPTGANQTGGNHTDGDHNSTTGQSQQGGSGQYGGDNMHDGMKDDTSHAAISPALSFVTVATLAIAGIMFL